MLMTLCERSMQQSQGMWPTDVWLMELGTLSFSRTKKISDGMSKFFARTLQMQAVSDSAK